MDSAHVTETRTTIVMVVCLIAGVAIGIASMTVIFPLAPTELSRTGVLMYALHHRSDAPPVVVLGNSVVMNGIDAHHLGTGHVAWNLASTGQDLSEAMLIVDALPRSVHTVAIGISPDTLFHKETAMPPNKYVGYVMAGYSPSADAIAVTKRLHDQTLYKLLLTNRVRVVMWSRWVVRAMADLIARRFIRKDLDLERARTDLYFPAPYTQPVSAAALERLVTTNYSDYRQRFVAQTDPAVLLQGINDLATARGKHVVFFVTPEHPRRQVTTSAEFYAGFAQWENKARAEGLDIVDFRSALEAADFVDHIHPGGHGTVRLTQLLDLNLKHAGS
jgi:hypothetical protein